LVDGMQGATAWYPGQHIFPFVDLKKIGHKINLTTKSPFDVVCTLPHQKGFDALRACALS
jgi:hypothetical protein